MQSKDDITRSLANRIGQAAQHRCDACDRLILDFDNAIFDSDLDRLHRNRRTIPETQMDLLRRQFGGESPSHEGPYSLTNYICIFDLTLKDAYESSTRCPVLREIFLGNEISDDMDKTSFLATSCVYAPAKAHLLHYQPEVWALSFGVLTRSHTWGADVRRPQIRVLPNDIRFSLLRLEGDYYTHINPFSFI